MYLGYYVNDRKLLSTGVCLSYAEVLEESTQLLADFCPSRQVESYNNFAGVLEVEPGWSMICLFRRLVCVHTRQEALAELQTLLDEHEGIENEQRQQRWAEREQCWR